MKLPTVLIAGLALLYATNAAAQAQPVCAPRDSVVTQLKVKYGETARSIGLVAQGQMMELFASEETGSWTIAVTMPTGTTCLVATGQNFETIATPAALPGAPA